MRKTGKASFSASTQSGFGNAVDVDDYLIKNFWFL